MKDKRMIVLIDKAKDYLQKKADMGRERAWVGPVELIAYNFNIEDEGIRIWALQGSPLRGLVIANYALGEVSVLNCNMRRIRVFHTTDL